MRDKTLPCGCGRMMQSRSKLCAHCARLEKREPIVRALRFEVIEAIEFLQAHPKEWHKIPGAVDFAYMLKSGDWWPTREYLHNFWGNAKKMGYERVMPGIIIPPPREEQPQTTSIREIEPTGMGRKPHSSA